MDLLAYVAAKESEKEEDLLQENDYSDTSDPCLPPCDSRPHHLPIFPERAVPFIAIWDYNLQDHMEVMVQAIESHPFISLQMRFVGSLAEELCGTPTTPAQEYVRTAENLNALRPVQLSLTFSDADGDRYKFPGTHQGCVLQFNLRIDDSIDQIDSGIRKEMQKRSGNLMHTDHGVHPMILALFFWSTRPLMDPGITWISCNPAYDFGALLKIVRVEMGDLPQTRDSFFDLLSIYFPVFYDVKHLAEKCMIPAAGDLTDTARAAGVLEAGKNRGQETPESLLAMDLFWELAGCFPVGKLDDHVNFICGLGRRRMPEKEQSQDTKVGRSSPRLEENLLFI